ncbi:MAG: hypothetical protein BWY54_01002 [Candidatus Dependentiae bacterium ADurb.Bin331]|nr:MAG: hypothetical protein BWY54_01002 [Candidatus Dependentiae bacterium ADurb.Bin331]
MFKNKNNIVITFLSVALLVCLFLLLKSEPTIPYDENLINTRINTLEQENDQLQKDIQSERLKSANFMMKIDSLKKQAPIIEYKYIKIYEKIDSSSVIDVVNEFDSIFTTNRIH